MHQRKRRQGEQSERKNTSLASPLPEGVGRGVDPDHVVGGAVGGGIAGSAVSAAAGGASASLITVAGLIGVGLGMAGVFVYQKWYGDDKSKSEKEERKESHPRHNRGKPESFQDFGLGLGAPPAKRQ